MTVAERLREVEGNVALAEIADAVEVTRSGVLRWMGAPIRHPHGAMVRTSDPSDALRKVLSSTIYSRAYCTGGPIPLQFAGAPAPELGGPNVFAEALAAAFPAGRTWDDGWSDLGGGVLAAPGRPRIVVAPDARTEREGAVAAEIPNIWPARLPGFIGFASLQRPVGPHPVRIYMHVEPRSAPSLVAAVAHYVMGAGVSFVLKVLADPSGFWRGDAAVLYVVEDELELAASALCDVHCEVADGLVGPSPLFTLPLVEGVAAAADPGTGLSFGEARCWALAEGLSRWAVDPRGNVGAMGSMRAALRRDGVDDAAPHGLSAAACHVLMAFPRRRPTRRAPAFSASPPAVDRGAAALQIAASFDDSAFWSGGQCTWLSRTDWGGHTSVGLDLYEGISGIALFLAEVHRAEPDARWQRLGRGAVRKGIDLLACRAPTHGLHTGSIGAAATLVRAGRLLGDEAAVEQAVDHLRGSAAKLPREWDVIGGSAGSVLALLAAAQEVGDGDLVVLAGAIGSHLVEQAVTTREGLAWASMVDGRRRRLAGIAHGASGAALALLELDAAIGGFAASGCAALRFDDGFVGPAAGTWIDSRRASRSRSNSWSWCYGSVGAALVRVRAYQLTGEPAYRLLASDTARASVRSVQELGDVSLCHGRAGTAVAAFEVARRLGMDAVDGASESSEAILAALAADCARWPVSQMGAMTGQAGLGLAFLGAAAPVLGLIEGSCPAAPVPP